MTSSNCSAIYVHRLIHRLDKCNNTPITIQFIEKELEKYPHLRGLYEAKLEEIKIQKEKEKLLSLNQHQLQMNSNHHNNSNILSMTISKEKYHDVNNHSSKNLQRSASSATSVSPKKSPVNPATLLQQMSISSDASGTRLRGTTSLSAGPAGVGTEQNEQISTVLPGTPLLQKTIKYKEKFIQLRGMAQSSVYSTTNNIMVNISSQTNLHTTTTTNSSQPSPSSTLSSPSLTNHSNLAKVTEKSTLSIFDDQRNNKNGINLEKQLSFGVNLSEQTSLSMSSNLFPHKGPITTTTTTAAAMAKNNPFQDEKSFLLGNPNNNNNHNTTTTTSFSQKNHSNVYQRHEKATTYDPTGMTESKGTLLITKEAKKQEDLSQDLVNLTSKLKSNALAFQDKLAKDASLVQSTEILMESNLQDIKSVGKRLNLTSVKNRGLFWISCIGMLVVFIVFMLTFVFIRIF